MPHKHRLALLANNLTGDLGGITYITRKGGAKIAYVKTYPARADTPKRRASTNRFRLAALAWNALDDPHKQALRDIEKQFNFHCTGRSVFIGCHMTRRIDLIVAWCAQIGFTW